MQIFIEAQSARSAARKGRARRCAALALCAWLPACGGGGTAASADAAVAAASNPGSTDAGTTTAPGAEIGCGQAAFRDEALRLINERRAAGASCGSEGSFAPAPAVAWSDRLAQAAYGHSLDMAARNYFSHTSPEGSTPAARIGAAGYAWSAIGENISGGYPTVAAVVSGWMASPGHCRNIMTSGFREIGMACAKSSASQYGLYYTLDLATPR